MTTEREAIVLRRSAGVVHFVVTRELFPSLALTTSNRFERARVELNPICLLFCAIEPLSEDMMTHSDLLQMLHELRDSLAHGQTLDANSKEALKGLAAEIQQVLDSTSTEDADEPATDESESVTERIQAYVESLEAQHPALTRTLSMIAERLSDMGI